MTEQLDQYAPDAPLAVRLAARSQHICRWTIARRNYPEGRDGYRRWRSDLAEFHAETAGRILGEVGYDRRLISRVQSLLRKQQLKTDPDCQLLEDTICLVFLGHYLGEFAGRHDEAKLTHILRRTWEKMSTRGQQAALELDLPQNVRALVEKAIRGQP